MLWCESVCSAVEIHTNIINETNIKYKTKCSKIEKKGNGALPIDLQNLNRKRKQNGFWNIYDLLRRFFDLNSSISDVLFVHCIRKSKRIDGKMEERERGRKKNEHKF